MTDRVRNVKPGGSTGNLVSGTSRPGTGGTPGSKTKAEKRAEAKAAKARALAAKKRRQVLRVAGSAAAVALLIVGVVLLVNYGSHKTQSTASASASPSSTAFPPVPADADPALRTKPKATAGTGTLSKLAVTTLITGKGPAVQSGQTINVNYVGVTYKDGKEFDSSWSHSQAFSFQLGAGNVIPGWDQGLVGVTVGSRVQLDIPANLAYGDNPTSGQPGGALRFVVDVLSAS